LVSIQKEPGEKSVDTFVQIFGLDEFERITTLANSTGIRITGFERHWPSHRHSAIFTLRRDQQNLSNPRFNMTDAPTTSSAGDGTTSKTKPERPNQAKFESDLADAEKEYTARTEKFVRRIPMTISSYHNQIHAYICSLYLERSEDSI
jgi:hypothetical protein